LELYFEHRNYLPLVGPVFAVVASLQELRAPWRRLAAVALTVYATLLGGVLYSVSSLWGDPELSAEVWQLYHPNSLRANQHLAAQLETQSFAYASRRLLSSYVENNPGAYGVELQVLSISCQLEPESDHAETIRKLEDRLATSRFNSTVVSAFQKIAYLVTESKCSNIGDDSVYGLGEAILTNPAFQAGAIRHVVHVEMGRIAARKRDFNLTITHLEAALRAFQNPNTLRMAMNILVSAGRQDIAQEFLNEAQAQSPPRNPFRALQWRRDLEDIEALLNRSVHQSSGAWTGDGAYQQQVKETRG
jgi:hypothetical protein